MPEDTEQTRALADRLISYADALVAVAFVGMSGLCLALADPDIRTDIARVTNWIILANVFMGCLLSGLIQLFRRWELELRDSLPSVAAAHRFSRYLHWGRLGVIWVSVAQAVAVMFVIR